MSSTCSVFEKCKQYTTDPFWYDLFDRLSKGRFTDSIIDFNSKDYSVTFAYTFVSTKGEKKRGTCKRKPKRKESLELFELIKNQMHRFGIHSHSEIPQNFCPLFVFTKWNYIKTKSVKEELISRYVDTKCSKNPNKFFEILSLLQVKHITHSDIEMSSKGEIENINIKPLPKVTKTNFPRYEYPKKPTPLSLTIIKFSKERFARGGNCS